MSALQTITSSSMVAIIRSRSYQDAKDAANALWSAGLNSFEFTTTTPQVFDLIEEFSKIDRLNVGVGTAMNTDHVSSAEKAGALKFRLGGPLLNDGVSEIPARVKGFIEAIERARVGKP